MELHSIYFKLLSEQINNDQDNELNPLPDDIENPEPDNNDDPAPNDDLDPDNRPEFDPNPQPVKVSKYNSAQYKLIKNKWLTENPGLDDDRMDSYIDGFNQRKNGFRPYRENYRAENAVMRNIPNMPEVVSLKQRYPNYPSESLQKIKDIGSFTWDQLEFFIDRFNTEDNISQVVFNVVGNTPEIRLENAYAFWRKSSPTKIIDENGIIVHKISGRDESIAYGRLQNYIVNKYGGANWCITSDTPTSTYYNSYRNRRSYYFILRIGEKNTSNERNKYYVSCIQPSIGNEGPFVITNRSNDGDETKRSWEYIVNLYPQLNGKQKLFKYNSKTKKEMFSESLDKITFNNNSNDPYNFNNQLRSIQNQYIQNGRNIMSLNAILTLNNEQLNSYVRGMTRDNYCERFKSRNGGNAFEIIDYFESEKPTLYRDIDMLIKRKPIVGNLDAINVPSGVNSIKDYIFSTSYTMKMKDQKNENICLIVNNSNNFVGLYDKETHTFLKKPSYTHTQTKYFPRQNPHNMMTSTFYISRYSISNNYINIYGDDYFYTICNSEHYSVVGRDQFVGMFFTKEKNNIDNGTKIWDGANNLK